MDSSTANQIVTPANQNFFLAPQFPLQRQHEVRSPPRLPRRWRALRRRRSPLRL